MSSTESQQQLDDIDRIAALVNETHINIFLNGVFLNSTIHLSLIGFQVNYNNKDATATNYLQPGTKTKPLKKPRTKQRERSKKQTLFQRREATQNLTD